MAASFAVTHFLLPLFFLAAASAEMDNNGRRCYSCTSYMSQCKAVVNDEQNDVFKASCTGKCFVRMGEDGAMYRGCFDGFVEVGELRNGYTGCRNQTWNGKTLPWCLCEDDLCNGDTMDMAHFYNIDAFTQTNYQDDDGSKYNEVTAYDSDVYTYNEVENSYGANAANQQPAYNYDGEKSANQNDVYNYDSTERTNQDHSYMDKFAREAGSESPYDEALFGTNDVITRAGYPDFRTPYPKEYKVSYQSQSSGLDNGRQKFNYPEVEFQPERYYPYQPQYSRESGPEYNYIRDQYNDVYAESKQKTNRITSKLASKIRCSKSGYYQNPNDCRQFIACLMDPYSQTPVMHLMKCPEGLVWDNRKKICMQHSSTCHYDAEDRVDVTGYSSNPVSGQPYYGGSDAEKVDTSAVYRQPDRRSAVGQPTDGNFAFNDVEHVVF